MCCRATPQSVFSFLLFSRRSWLERRSFGAFERSLESYGAVHSFSVWVWRCCFRTTAFFFISLLLVFARMCNVLEAALDFFVSPTYVLASETSTELMWQSKSNRAIESEIGECRGIRYPKTKQEEIVQIVLLLFTSKTYRNRQRPLRVQFLLFETPSLP